MLKREVAQGRGADAQAVPGAPPRWSAHAGSTAAVVGVAFVVLVLTLQLMRADLDWVGAQLSLYLHGPYGLVLRTAYCVLAASMAWLALGLHAALMPTARSRTVLGLFWAAALGLSTVSIGDSWMPTLAPNAALMVHLLSAQAAFLCVIAGLLLQSWYFRHDPRWRSRFVPAFGLGLVTFAVLLFNVSVHTAPRGISQKTAIVLIVIWLTLVGSWLARAARSSHSRDNARVNQP